MKTMINDEGIVIMKINERENDKKKISMMISSRGMVIYELVNVSK